MPERDRERSSTQPLIGGLLRLLSESVREQILQAVWDRGYTDITRAHLAVFQFPSPAGETPSRLAARAFTTKQSMNYLLRELEDRGYLARRDAAGDRRGRSVHLTKRGQRLVLAMKEAVKDVERRWRTTIGAHRFSAMEDALRELYQATVEDEGVT
jgi:DNA-binding MarR family transcriptional regulator